MITSLSVALLVATTPPSSPELLVGPQRVADSTTSSSKTQTRKDGRTQRIVGGVLLGLGLASRIGIESFWFAHVQLRAREPFGQWSYPNIAVLTNTANLPTGVGIALLARGAYLRGATNQTQRVSPLASTIGKRLFAVGAGLFVASRLFAYPMMKSCQTNGCAYGYLESTYWASVALAVPGSYYWMLGRGTESQTSTGGHRVQLSVVPNVVPANKDRALGLGLVGRF